MGRIDKASGRRVPKNQIDPRMTSGFSGYATSSVPSVQEESTKKTKMTLGKINFSGVTDFTPAPANSYLSTFKSWEEKQNSPNGNNPDGSHVLAVFVIADGSEYEGKQLRVRWALTEKALWRIRQDLVTLGADPEALAGDDVDLAAVINSMVGKQAILDVKVSEYEDSKTKQTRQTNEVTGLHEASVGRVAARR